MRSIHRGDSLFIGLYLFGEMLLSSRTESSLGKMEEETINARV